jgi:hypothetical protein
MEGRDRIDSYFLTRRKHWIISQWKCLFHFFFFSFPEVGLEWGIKVVDYYFNIVTGIKVVDRDGQRTLHK